MSSATALPGQTDEQHCSTCTKMKPAACFSGRAKRTCERCSNNKVQQWKRKQNLNAALYEMQVDNLRLHELMDRNASQITQLKGILAGEEMEQNSISTQTVLPQGSTQAEYNVHTTSSGPSSQPSSAPSSQPSSSLSGEGRIQKSTSLCENTPPQSAKRKRVHLSAPYEPARDEETGCVMEEIDLEMFDVPFLEGGRMLLQQSQVQSHSYVGSGSGNGSASAETQMISSKVSSNGAEKRVCSDRNADVQMQVAMMLLSIAVILAIDTRQTDFYVIDQLLLFIAAVDTRPSSGYVTTRTYGSNLWHQPEMCDTANTMQVNLLFENQSPGQALLVGGCFLGFALAVWFKPVLSTYLQIKECTAVLDLRTLLVQVLRAVLCGSFGCWIAGGLVLDSRSAVRVCQCTVLLFLYVWLSPTRGHHLFGKFQWLLIYIVAPIRFMGYLACQGEIPNRGVFEIRLLFVGALMDLSILNYVQGMLWVLGLAILQVDIEVGGALIGSMIAGCATIILKCWLMGVHMGASAPLHEVHQHHTLQPEPISFE